MRGRTLTIGVLGMVLAACSPTSTANRADEAGRLPATDHVHALRATDDGALLLGLHGALWRSTDGKRWEQLGLEGLDAMALGVAVEGEPLLVGGHDVLARSDDGGREFEMLSPADLPSLDIHALAQAPSDPNIVYAFVVGHGIYRSTDAGDTWIAAARAGAQLPQDLAAMAIDPSAPETVLVGSGSQGVLRSTDGASSWAQTGDWGTLGLAFTDEGTVLAATYRGVDVSEDGGLTWRNAAPIEELEGQPVAVTIGPDGTWWVLSEGPRVLHRSPGGDGALEEVARA